MDKWNEALESVQGMDRAGMIVSVRPSYGRKTVHFDPARIAGLTDMQLMCIADRGIPPFGGTVQGAVVTIYTD